MNKARAVYANLEEFLKYRRATTAHKWVDAKALERTLSSDEFVMIEAHSEHRTTAAGLPEPCFVFLGAPGSRFFTKSNELRRMLSTIPRGRADGANVVLIGELDIKKPLMDTLRKSLPESYVEYYVYDMCTIIKPRHVQYPPQVLATDADLENLTLTNVALQDIGRAYPGEVGVAWTGARPGEFIKTIRPSPVILTSNAYRYVAHGSAKEIDLPDEVSWG